MNPSPSPPPWTDEDSAALDRAARRLRPKSTKPMKAKRRPQPQRMGNGRWRMRFVYQRQHFKRTFDTYQQAADWRDSITDQGGVNG